MASQRQTNANYMALELAAPFLCPRIGALAATCKELRTASLSTITWTPFFRRRYPCLAAVEHFAAPSDARARSSRGCCVPCRHLNVGSFRRARAMPRAARCRCAVKSFSLCSFPCAAQVTPLPMARGASRSWTSTGTQFA